MYISGKMITKSFPWSVIKSNTLSKCWKRVTINEAPVTYSSDQKCLISFSPSKCDYIALSTCIKDVLYFRQLVKEFLINGQSNLEHLWTSILKGNSSPVISLVTQPKISEQNDHIYIKTQNIKALVSIKARHITSAAWI